MEQLNKQISENAGKLAASTKSTKYVLTCIVLGEIYVVIGEIYTVLSEICMYGACMLYSVKYIIVLDAILE